MKRVETQVVTAPGLEAITTGELAKLGVRVARTGRGGLSCDMTFAQLALAHLQLRTATRVLVRLRRFKAERFDQVTRGVAAIDWSAYLPVGQPVEVRASATGSRLFHTEAIAEAVIEGLPTGHVPSDGSEPSTRLAVRVAHDVATVSIDASGDALHRRGYRTHVGDAPMRETLASALLLWSGWTGREALTDPCCGAGTIPIEAAMWARRIAPGAGRRFAFEEWPSADAAAVERVRAGVAADVLPRVKAPIVGRDIDPRVVEAARANAERAGVAGDVVFEVADVRRHDAAPTFVVTNPPYGRRLGADLPAVYAAIARSASTLAVVLPAGARTAWIGRPVVDELGTTNGGIPIAFVRG